MKKSLGVLVLLTLLMSCRPALNKVVESSDGAIYQVSWESGVSCTVELESVSGHELPKEAILRTREGDWFIVIPDDRPNKFRYMYRF